MGASRITKRRVLIVHRGSDASKTLANAMVRSASEDDEDSLDESAVEFEITAAADELEASRYIAEATAMAAPISVAFVVSRGSGAAEDARSIRCLWKADPNMQVVLCGEHAEDAWSAVSTGLRKTDRLLLLRLPIDPSEAMQMALALSRKWELAQRQVLQLEAANSSLQRELAERRRIEERLRHDALHDALTRLPNRMLLVDRLSHALERLRRVPDVMCAVLFLDLDNFKLVNDSLGHAAGDAVLIQVADRLVTTVRSSDTIGRPEAALAGRLGGDEFVVVLESVSDPEQAKMVSERLLELLHKPIMVEGRELVISVSVGLAFGTADHTAESLLREADVAMYRSKHEGRANEPAFRGKTAANALDRLTIEADLRSAVERNELVLAYQPIVELETGAIAGFESLVRWKHPNRGIIDPEVFIPIAEEAGLIHQVGEWVLHRACLDMADWRRRGVNQQGIYFSVNISRLQLLGPGFVDMYSSILQRTGVDPRLINIEVTENTVMRSEETAVRALQAVRRMGSKTFMDDFGTGHSSLSCLHRLPIDVVKIDRAFVNTLRASPGYAAVVYAIVTLAHNLKIGVIAEGVESVNHMVQLQAFDCDHVQGYLFSRPVGVIEAEGMLMRGFANMRVAA